MCTFWAVAVTLLFGSECLGAPVNFESLQRSSADDVIQFVDQQPTIYQSSPGTYRHFDGQQQLECELCEPGHYRIKHCDAEHWRTCEQCPHNFYMPYYNNGDKCRSCGDTCDSDRYLVTLQECSPTAPRRCACQSGTAMVYLGSNGPGMCKPFETDTTDPKHDNTTSLQASSHEETTEKTTTSVTNGTTRWDLDSSLANDTLSYDLAESEPIVGPLAGLAGFIVLVIIAGGAWYSYHSTSEEEEDDVLNKDIDLLPVFDYVADHVGKDWRRLARKLPGTFPKKSDLDSIEERHRSDLREMAYDMLLDWKQKKGDEASLRYLQEGP
ncbi:tumor necrosis factor receptor superfamily member 11B-like [Branchiostoma lanceolatum]|uniref:tumor necrosis factor receptor superfamily member 11B-like n=1 Tax=Branchiostoma lanceolatum TaxID=7740 RepID=UPI00345231A4